MQLMMQLRPSIGTAALSLGLTACFGEGNVVRVVDGHEIEGRFIEPDAYAAYLEGAYEEARDNPQGALASYERALAIDPSSVELRTRIASIQCRNGTLDIETAFAPARRLTDDYAPIWTEMANCAVTRGKIAEALPYALHAAALAPFDPDVTNIVVRVYELSGRSADAERWRAAWQLLEHPQSGKPPESPATKLEIAQLTAEIDDALEAGDLERSRALAIRARIPAGEIAVRAAARGKSEEALEQAILVLRANPDDTDAWVGAVVAADLASNDDLLRQWLKRVPLEATPPGNLSVSMIAELLERRVGTEASSAWKTRAEAGVESGH